MSYRALVAHSHPTFLVLGLLARLPYATSPLATLILLEHTTGSYAFAGLAGAAQCVAIAAGGPAVGALADRFGNRVVGVATALANLVALLGLLLASGDQQARPAMLLAATLTGLTQPQVGPLVRVHWSRVLPRPLVPTAMSYESAADEIGFVAGPVLIGVLLPFGPVAPMIATMVLLAVATAPFALVLTGSRPPRRGTGQLPKLRLAGLFLAMVAVGAVFGAVQTGVTAYADETGRPGLAGLLYGLLGVGSALMGAACAWLPQGFLPHQRYVTFACTLLAGTALLLTPLPPPVTIAVAGLTIAPYLVVLYTLTERLAPPDRAAVAMTVLSAGGPLGTAAGRAVSGYLADDHGSTGAFAVAPATAAAGLLLALLTARHLRRTEPSTAGVEG